MRKENTGFSLGSFILGLFYLFAGYIALRNPLISNTYIVILIATVAILNGVIDLILRNKLNKYHGSGGGILIFSAIISIIFGVFILFNLSFSIIALPMAFAFYLLFSSITSIFRIWPIRKVSNGAFIGLLIINILGIILAFMLIRNPLASFFTVANIIGL